MKQRIFNRGKGWYIPCSNRNDKTDKAYLSVGFPKGETPPFDPVDEDYVFLDIDILEARFTSYKNKAGMFVFKYVIVEHTGELTELAKDGDHYAEHSMFGANNVINSDDLPFY